MVKPVVIIGVVVAGGVVGLAIASQSKGIKKPKPIAPKPVSAFSKLSHAFTFSQETKDPSHPVASTGWMTKQANSINAKIKKKFGQMQSETTAKATKAAEDVADVAQDAVLGLTTGTALKAVNTGGEPIPSTPDDRKNWTVNTIRTAITSGVQDIGAGLAAKIDKEARTVISEAVKAAHARMAAKATELQGRGSAFLASFFQSGASQSTAIELDDFDIAGQGAEPMI